MAIFSSAMQLFQSFVRGGGQGMPSLGQLWQMASMLLSAKTGLVALPGGAQAGATPLPAAWNRVDTCATNADSVGLPQALPGQFVAVYNNTAQTVQVFGQATNPITGVGDTITAQATNTVTATGTGIALTTAQFAIFVCFAQGNWKMFLSA